ncbi:MAG: tRNA epoxyqueuosine(34) reductase QueG [Pelolinea sp.]|nr:tRNA epoxyqueuosine(34) reductase QueG [Pelolinea sp.]
MKLKFRKSKAKAKALGFTFASITNVEQSPHFNEFMDWLNKNQYGQLDFLHEKYVIDSRREPSQLLDNAQSMIVLGVNYGPLPHQEHENPLRFGKIASYAQFEDYHAIIKSKATALMDSINSDRSQKIDSKIFIDSGPLMEKDFAFAAGLGWIGKNSLLIHPVLGSFSFLCCIITNEMVGEIPNHCEDLCGDCQLCMQACPTKCISGDHTINVSRCISYLTIEFKGIIPRDLRGQIGDWIFGCDVCQSVCPHNLNIPIPQSKLFFGAERIFDGNLDLCEEMALSEKAFSIKYQGTPLIRASYEQYQRNLIITAGNNHEHIFAEPLNNYLFFGSENLRAHAAWALGEIASEDCINILQTQLENEKSTFVKEEIEFALYNQR